MVEKLAATPERFPRRPGMAGKRPLAYATIERMNSRVYALANQKGGVGKTTTAINMAACVAEAGTPVLLIDLDPQANATTGLGFRPDQLEASTYDLLHGASLDDVVRRDVDAEPVPGAVASRPGRGRRWSCRAPRHDTLLRDLLAGTGERYPYVFVDCPPSLGLLTVNALSAANRLIVPVQCEYYALEGLAQLLAERRAACARGLNPRLGVTGVLLTMYDGRTRLSSDVAERGARALRRRWSSRRSCRAASGSPRRPATACRSPDTTPARRAPTRTIGSALEVVERG